MIAKVITSDGREYYSAVFARFFSGWYSAVITYDREHLRFDYTEMYNREPSLARKVFILDTDETGWDERGTIRLSLTDTLTDARGFSWILDDTALLKKIVKGQPLNEDVLYLAEKYCESVEESEWHYVKNAADAENLMSAAWGFHDSIIQKISYAHAFCVPHRAEIVFSSCWYSSITLAVEGDILLHFSGDDGFMPDIFGSSVFFEDGRVYWTDSEASSVKDIPEDGSYFAGRALKWKLETEENE